MGVERFIGTALDGLIVGTLTVIQQCRMVSLDMNQHIYNALELLTQDSEACQTLENEVKAKKAKRESIDYNFNVAPDVLKRKFRVCCLNVIGGIINELEQFPNLSEIYVSVDGYPCLGKIQNQIARRKKPNRYYANYKQFYDKDGNKCEKKDSTSSKDVSELVFSAALIIAETEIMNIFVTAMVEKFTNFQKKKNIYLSISGPEIPGEGEHKAIDNIRRSPYSSFTRGVEQIGPSNDTCCLLWSNDSDVIISMLHQDFINVYVMTEHIKGSEKVIKCVSLVDIRRVFVNVPQDRYNVSLLLAFQGNDYLPQMMDTLDLKSSYLKHRSFSINLTKDPENTIDIKVVQNDEITQENERPKSQSQIKKVSFKEQEQTNNGQRLIDFRALESFFKLMASEEIELYHKIYESPGKFGRNNLRTQFGNTDHDIQRNNLRSAIEDRVGFKRKYYTEVYKALVNAYGKDKIPTYDLGESLSNTKGIVPQSTSCCVSTTPYLKIDENPTDQQLYILEMNMAVAYMKTYVWYYYYQSGYYVPEPLDNSFYPYGLAPLYSSLYILLNRGPVEFRLQFDLEFNQKLQPALRTQKYFESLPSYTKIQHFSVLQTIDLRLLYPEITDIEKENPDLIQIKEKIPYKTTIATRIAGNFVHVYPFMPLWYLIEKYKNTENHKKETLIVGNRSADIARVTRSKYTLKGFATFA